MLCQGIEKHNFAPLMILSEWMVELRLSVIKKYFFLFLGTISLALGIVGIILPLLPTTPLLLLTSFCYLRSSERMYNWLINHKVFGAYIYAYLTYRAIAKNTKIRIVFFLWLTLIISMFFVPLAYVRLFLVVVGIGVTIHIMMLKTLSVEEMKALNNKQERENFCLKREE